MAYMPLISPLQAELGDLDQCRADRIVGEDHQRFDRRLGIGAGARQGRVERAVLAHQRDRARQVRFDLFLLFERLLEFADPHPSNWTLNQRNVERWKKKTSRPPAIQ